MALNVPKLGALPKVALSITGCVNECQERTRDRDGMRRNAHTTSTSVHLRHRVAVLHRSLGQTMVTLTDRASPTAIHNTRVAARRLRVLLRTFRKEFDSEEVKRYMRHLKGITRDLEAAREADVTRHAIMQLGRNRRGHMNSNSRELYERAVKRYESAIYDLRMTIAGDPWQQRLTDLWRLSVLSSLVKENDDLAATVMHRVVKRRRRGLRRKLSKVGRSPKRLHRVRLKVKAMRYILAGCLSNRAVASNSEVKCLRQLQNCLGDMHDEENLFKALRAEQRHHEAARDIAGKLQDRKSGHLHAFKGYRKDLMRLWDSAAFSTGHSGEMM